METLVYRLPIEGGWRYLKGTLVREVGAYWLTVTWGRGTILISKRDVVPAHLAAGLFTSRMQTTAEAVA